MSEQLGCRKELKEKIKAALALAREFVEMYGDRFPEVISVFGAGIGDALTYLRHSRKRTTNRTYAGVHVSGGKEEDEGDWSIPNEVSASTSATETALRNHEQWMPKHYFTMEAFETAGKLNTQLSSPSLRLRWGVDK